jgi:hypothetical protein
LIEAVPGSGFGVPGFAQVQGSEFTVPAQKLRT